MKFICDFDEKRNEADRRRANWWKRRKMCEIIRKKSKNPSVSASSMLRFRFQNIELKQERAFSEKKTKKNFPCLHRIWSKEIDHRIFVYIQSTHTHSAYPCVNMNARRQTQFLFCCFDQTHLLFLTFKRKCRNGRKNGKAKEWNEMQRMLWSHSNNTLNSIGMASYVLHFCFLLLSFFVFNLSDLLENAGHNMWLIKAITRDFLQVFDFPFCFLPRKLEIFSFSFLHLLLFKSIWFVDKKKNGKRI